MAHFAKIESGIVTTVIVADQAFIDTQSGTWVQTSYDSTADAFYAPRPFASWTLDTNTYLWNPPTAHPNDGNRYTWNEDTRSWDAYS